MLTTALVEQRRKIGGFRAFVGGSFAGTVDPAFADDISYISYIGMGRNAALAKTGRLDILPCSYSRIADSLTAPDLVLVQAAEGPDGIIRYALACEYLPALAARAKAVVAEVNAEAPWSPGAPPIDTTQLAAVMRTSREVLQAPATLPDRSIARIAEIVAGLVEDRSTLQIGVGALPEAALKALSSHSDLGIHSGAIGDGVARLIEAGVVNNSRKKQDAGVTIAGIFFGGAALNRVAHGNHTIRLAPTSYTHHAPAIAAIDRFVSLNSAVEVDLYGSVNSEVANGAYVGGVGGGGEFARAAAQSRGGFSIIALTATAAGGKISRIVSRLSGPTTISRSDAGVVVTEFGAADLRGKTLSQRRKMMLDIAHPDFRAELEASAT
ncbi:acetyl-CoA hydrolase/transferase family protein [Oryzicola mucosus]|uniref:Acetyl-CoA hydrolase n=1 Tax=Oryzicola mucosus TaxID=2767425 RepID=A0A8J6PPC6_9HYPH|nr:acetyl-CoA hydrolase/transferase C-terminal domain-containing protein [Oryzicola mucosus]MBD0417381.1 acetyl-CoA hydrolase [Oryzicola mucosus]